MCVYENIITPQSGSEGLFMNMHVTSLSHNIRTNFLLNFGGFKLKSLAAQPAGEKYHILSGTIVDIIKYTYRVSQKKVLVGIFPKNGCSLSRIYHSNKYNHTGLLFSIVEFNMIQKYNSTIQFQNYNLFEFSTQSDLHYSAGNLRL